MKRAVVAGGTGLIGGHLLDELAARRVPTTAFGRRAGPPRPGVDWRVIDLAAIDARAIPPGTDAAFCALGTTIRAAGSQEAFRAVDQAMVLAFARACHDAGIPQFHCVSAMGANPRSRIFYSRVKGEVEGALEGLGFASLVLYRPSLLSGVRVEPRPGEGAGLAVARALRPLLPRRYRAIGADVVARAMVLGGRAAPPGTTILSSQQVARAGS